MHSADSAGYRPRFALRLARRFSFQRRLIFCFVVSFMILALRIGGHIIPGRVRDGRAKQFIGFRGRRQAQLTENLSTTAAYFCRK